MVPSAFFDDGVSNHIKLQMIQAVRKPVIEMLNNGIVIDYKDKADQSKL